MRAARLPRSARSPGKLRDMTLDDLRAHLAALLDFAAPETPPEFGVVTHAERDGYVEQRVVFRGPEGDVPAFLLVPGGAGRPLPAVVVHHQHHGEWHVGKSEVAGLAGDPLQAFGPAHVYGGVCMIAGTLTADGDIVQLTGLHRLAYGPLDGTPDRRLTAITEALSGAGFDSEATATITQQMWEKWLFLASLGVVTTLMRSPVGAVLAAPGGPAFTDRVIAEATAIVTAAGHPPREQALTSLRASITNARTVPTTSSMYRDMQAGLPVEADAIVGDLVAHAERLGVDAPLYAAAYTNLAVYAAGRDI